MKDSSTCFDQLEYERERDEKIEVQTFIKDERKRKRDLEREQETAGR